MHVRVHHVSYCLSGNTNSLQWLFRRVNNAGSFIRPNAAIVLGVSFLTALVRKYTDTPHGDAVEKVILGSSNGAIEVEAVRLNKIRANLSRLDTLREVSLDNEYVARADDTGEIRKTCPGK
jgi:tubulin-specific chaperone E